VTNNFAMPGSPAAIELGYLVGKDVAKHHIPVKSVLEAGAQVTLSSDWDVSSVNPFIGLANAIARGVEEINMKVKQK
jgi:predicted amidohydrolase YtcJ